MGFLGGQKWRLKKCKKLVERRVIEGKRACGRHHLPLLYFYINLDSVFRRFLCFI